MILGIIIFVAGCFIATQNTQSKIAWPLIIVGLVLIAVPVSAHDHNRPGLDSWYSSLRSGNGPCCGGPSVDATTLDGPDWETKDGKYRVRIDGEWIDVPDDAVVNEPNKDGRTLVWPMKYMDGSIHIRCFMPGMMT